MSEFPGTRYPDLDKSLYCSATDGVPGRARFEKVSSMSIKAIASRFHNWRRYRAAVRELSLLSDRELGDLGLSRPDIETVARRSANF